MTIEPFHDCIKKVRLLAGKRVQWKGRKVCFCCCCCCWFLFFVCFFPPKNSHSIFDVHLFGTFYDHSTWSKQHCFVFLSPGLSLVPVVSAIYEPWWGFTCMSAFTTPLSFGFYYQRIKSICCTCISASSTLLAPPFFFLFKYASA